VTVPVGVPEGVGPGIGCPPGPTSRAQPESISIAASNAAAMSLITEPDAITRAGEGARTLGSLCKGASILAEA
jgi:hypothetical protein